MMDKWTDACQVDLRECIWVVMKVLYLVGKKADKMANEMVDIKGQMGIQRGKNVPTSWVMSTGM
jgi:hypothetical protein